MLDEAANRRANSDSEDGRPGHSERQHDLRSAPQRSLQITFALIVGFMIAEVLGGFISGSLALLADAGHMLIDAAAIGIALGAAKLATIPPTTRRTYGYQRFEVLAVVLNALLLWLVAAWILFEAWSRIREQPEIRAEVMLVIGALGLVVNVLAAWILRGPSTHSLNLRGAMLHVVADLMSSAGVVASGILILALDWRLADPLLSIAVAVLIVGSTVPLIAKAVNVLLEGAPDDVDLFRLCKEMEDVEGVTLIHDIHLWSIRPGYRVFTAHILVDPDYEDHSDTLLGRLREISYHQFGLEHITIQLERSAKECRELHHIDHLSAERDRRERVARFQRFASSRRLWHR